MAWVHERVPDDYHPLPDLFFSHFPEVKERLKIFGILGKFEKSEKKTSEFSSPVCDFFFFTYLKILSFSFSFLDFLKIHENVFNFQRNFQNSQKLYKIFEKLNQKKFNKFFVVKFEKIKNK